MAEKIFLYSFADDKYVKNSDDWEYEWKSGINAFKYRTSNMMRTKNDFDRNDVSIVFKTSPDTLLNLAAKVVDAFPLPNVYDWSIEDICRWLRKCGYNQYQNTFRENFINGHKLLLLDASALCAMNIKDFDHIRDIAARIRSLYEYQQRKYAYSISLPPEFPLELYKKFRTQTGRIYDTTKCSDLLRRMQVLRKRREFLDHWEALENHLKLKRDPEYPERFGYFRHPIVRSRRKWLETLPTRLSETCKCTSTCKCFWKSSTSRPPYVPNSSITKTNPEKTRLQLLEKLYPYKYGDFLFEIYEFETTCQEITFHSRKSLSANVSLSSFL